MILASKLYEIYRSCFSYNRIVDQETINKIDEWVDRDLKWANGQARQLEQKPRITKMIRDFVGTAKQLNRIVSLRK